MISELKREGKTSNILCTQTLLGLVVATSIDALIVGITFSFFKQPIIFSILTIGIVSFLASFIGFYLGRGLPSIFRNKIKIIGGVILIILGVKILVEHLFVG
jgi:putative Mn2+ efflux pump MntP